jgi:transposase-like protein
VVKGLLEDLVDRGLDLQRRYLVVLDGSKALRAGVERVFGEQVEVQRCQIHKRRNVKEYLPENCQKDYDRRMRNAYAMSNYAEAKEALQKIFRQLERINPSAARSLEEGLEETLTVHRLGVGAVLRRKLATTNPIESCLSTVQRVARNVALDRHRTVGSRKEVPTHQRLSRNLVAEGTSESVAFSRRRSGQ